MSWLTPLGFLGLLGLVVLIIIYLIKPNYQNKIISSTFVWKLSLKYKKRKVPINTLRNILLFICQVLIISLIASMLAQPIIAKEEEPKEKVLIVDASASMMASTAGVTRFDRAVELARKEAVDLVNGGGVVTVILAHDEAEYLLQQVNKESLALIESTFDALVDPLNGNPCTYGTPDIDGAIDLAERITEVVAGVEVILYSDTDYINSGEVKVVPVGDISEWNAAILDVRAIVDENYYRFEIDVACYGLDKDISVYTTISGANGAETIDFKADVRCEGDMKTTIVYSLDEEDSEEVVEIFSYESVFVYVDEHDSVEYDNAFQLYGGEKPVLKIQYYSATPNNYFSSILMVFRDKLKYRWNIELDEVKGEEVPETTGYDLYIFEHVIPDKLPTDGVVILANPDEIPTSAGIRLGNVLGFGSEKNLEPGEAHPITDGLNVENILLTQYTKVTSYDGYTPLAYIGSNPVILAKNEVDQKIVVMSFSLNFSDHAVIKEFPLMMYNILEYYIPSTITEHVFDVNDSVSVNSRSEFITVVAPDGEKEYEAFPADLKLTVPGVYSVIQTPISGEEVVETFYVKVAEEESNINLVVDALETPYYHESEVIEDIDILFYFAIALVALLFVEWWLQTREQF